MIDYRTATSLSKVGAQPDPIVVEELRRKHPNVRLAWAPQQKCWALIDAPPNLPPVLLRPIPGRPTLANTVYFLDRIHPANLASKYAIDRFLSDLDQSPKQASAERDAEERIHEGSRELWKQLNKRILTPRHLVHPKR